MKRCIICRETKEAFNVEHVIPEAVGGKYTTNLVCIKCNSYLGTKIDHHLTEFFLIRMKRLEFGITGKTGNLRDPFVGPVTLVGTSDKKYSMKRSKDGKLYARPQPLVIPKINDQGALIGLRVSVPKSDEHTIQGIVDKFLSRNGLDRQSVQNEKIEYSESGSGEFSIQYFTIYWKVQLAMIKIAYEFAVVVLPQYFEDEKAVRISNLLLNCEGIDLDYLHQNRYLLHPEHVKADKEELSQTYNFNGNSHFVILAVTPYGTLCYVVIFGLLVEGVILSETLTAEYDKTFVLENDFVTGKWTIKDGVNTILASNL